MNVASPSPLVSIIALCYNHAPYVLACLESVRRQTYSRIELVVIDDASTDDSPALLRVFAARYPDVILRLHAQNQGNCRSFNEGLALSTGTYVIDLACDDVLLPERVARQVACLEARGPEVGVCFSNERALMPDGRPGDCFFPIDAAGRSRVPVPQGDVYAAVLARSFVPATTLLVRRSVLEALGGYDETLAYEDFDFWVRSARRWEYAYVDAVLMHKRSVPGSLGSRARAWRNTLLQSSLVVCRKAQGLNRRPTENRALATRVRYFLRQCWGTGHFELAEDFANLLVELRALHPTDALVRQACRWRIPVRRLYQWSAARRA
jgi:glycosyltransferase involved in cell wall biosynthesis